MWFSRLTSKLHRFTEKDPELRELMKRREEGSAQIETRIQEIAKATLDSEDNWLREMVRNDPACILEVATKCNAHANKG